MVRDWWPDEAATAGAEHLDPDFVARYDAKAKVDTTEDVELMVASGLGPGSTIVDLGAGTGVFAAAAARTGATVVAVDVSPVMVAAIRRRADFEVLDRQVGASIYAAYTCRAVEAGKA